MAQVRSIQLGYDGSLRHPGDVFAMEDRVAKTCPWVEVISLDVPELTPEEAAAKEAAEKAAAEAEAAAKKEVFDKAVAAAVAEELRKRNTK